MRVVVMMEGGKQGHMIILDAINSLQPMDNLGGLLKACTLPFTALEMLIWHIYIVWSNRI